jgi:hypothetical protein
MDGGERWLFVLFKAPRNNSFSYSAALIWYYVKMERRIVNSDCKRSTNINKTNSHLSPPSMEHYICR